MCRWLTLSVLLAFAAPAAAEPLDAPYRECSQQTLETAIAYEGAHLVRGRTR
jgi:hypothetical protein